MRLKNFLLDLWGLIAKLEFDEVEVDVVVVFEVVEDGEVVGATVILLLTKDCVVVLVRIVEIGSTIIGSIVIGLTVTTELVDLIG